MEYDLYVGNLAYWILATPGPVNCCWSSPAQSFFGSEACGAQDYIFLSRDSDSRASNSRSVLGTNVL
jgi:hypothetical protein